MGTLDLAQPVDEVLTEFCRTGDEFFSHQHLQCCTGNGGSKRIPAERRAVITRLENAEDLPARQNG